MADQPARTFDVSVITGEERPTWCDRCSLPAAFEFDMYMFMPGRVDPPASIGTLTVCTTCDADRFSADG